MEFAKAQELMRIEMLGKLMNVNFPFEAMAVICDVSHNSFHPDPNRFLGKIWKSPRKFEDNDIVACYVVLVYALGRCYSMTLNWREFSTDANKDISISEMMKNHLNNLKFSNLS